ncbi:MAG: GNAT family N-acetyltransferase [Lachnospiraceae bacterium]|nr:GNAT family N-acetyltransferase [Lachnospiraceae bacterium]
MKLTRITKENLEYFRMFLPPGHATQDQEALGLLTDDDIPCAAALISGTNGDAALDWIFVHPNNRRQGAGSILLEQIENLLRKETDSFSVAYPGESAGLDDFFAANGYLLTDGDAVYTLSLSELQKGAEARLLRKMSEKESVSALSALDASEKMSFLDLLVEEYGPDAHYFRCEPRISVAKLDQKRRVSSALLIAQDDVSKTLFLSAMVSKDKTSTMAVLGKALRITEDDPAFADYRIQFVSGNGSIDNLIHAMSVHMDRKDIEIDYIRYGVKSLEE